MKKVYSLREIAERFGVSDETVRKEILSGTLRAIRFGRQWRVLETDLDEYMSRRATQPAAL